MAPTIDTPTFKSLEPIFDFDNFRLASRIDAQATSALLRPNPKLEHAIANSHAKGLPPINVRPLAGQHLTILARLMGAKSVLEIGTLGGYSSICFADAGAKVTSIEISPEHRDVALENVAGLDVEVILGAAMDVLPRLVEEGRRFDLVFIDADLEGQWEQFNWAVKVTRKGGCVFLDDVVVSLLKDEMLKEGKTGEDESILVKVGRDERVVATLVPVVATHPMIPTPVFNGFIMAMVKD